MDISEIDENKILKQVKNSFDVICKTGNNEEHPIFEKYRKVLEKVFNYK